MSMKYNTDDLNRALAYMGYSTLQAQLSKARAYESDKLQVIQDALAAGMPQGKIIIDTELRSWPKK